MFDKPYWVAILEDGTSISQVAECGSLVLSSSLIGLPVTKLEIRGLPHPTSIPVPPDAIIKVFNKAQMVVEKNRSVTTKTRYFGYESASQGSLYIAVSLHDGSIYYESSYP